MSLSPTLLVFLSFVRKLYIVRNFDAFKLLSTNCSGFSSEIFVLAQ